MFSTILHKVYLSLFFAFLKRFYFLSYVIKLSKFSQKLLQGHTTKRVLDQLGLHGTPPKQTTNIKKKEEYSR
jgi:hypothetical protein